MRNARFVLRDTDLYLNDVFQVPLTRTYTSQEWAVPAFVQAFGRNTNHPFDIYPLGSRYPYTYQNIVFEDGDFVHFDRISKGESYADAVFQHSETASRFHGATTWWAGYGWITRLADGFEILFPEAYKRKTMAEAAPFEMRDPSGNVLELRRDSQRNLKEIRTPHGHWIRFEYDSLARITVARDDAGNWARYSYNADGMLTDAVLSSGRRRRYDYAGNLMKQVADEKGRVLLRNWYDSWWLERQQFANGMTYSYSYQWSASNLYVESVEVTSPDGTTRTIPIADHIPNFVKNFHK